MIWLDPHDEDVRAGVVDGRYGARPGTAEALPETVDGIDLITLSLRRASSVLTGLTGYAVHPSGYAVDEFAVSTTLRTLLPNYRPIREVMSLERVTADGPVSWAPSRPWLVSADVVTFPAATTARGIRGAREAWTFLCSAAEEGGRLRLRYRFGSTITEAARAAVLKLGHEFYLAATNDPECQLPERTSTVNREGVSYTLIDPQSYLNEGRTGVPEVDMWIKAVNPQQARRPAGVWSPESPPAVNVSVEEPWAVAV